MELITKEMVDHATPSSFSHVWWFVSQHSESKLQESENNEYFTELDRFIMNIIEMNDCIEAIDNIFKIMLRSGNILNELTHVFEFSNNLIKTISCNEPDILFITKVLFIFINLWKNMKIIGNVQIHEELFDIVLNFINYFTLYGPNYLFILCDILYYLHKYMDRLDYNSCNLSCLFNSIILTNNEKNVMSMLKLIPSLPINCISNENLPHIILKLQACMSSQNEKDIKIGLKLLKFLVENNAISAPVVYVWV